MAFRIAQHPVMSKTADHIISGSCFCTTLAHDFNVIVFMAMTGIGIAQRLQFTITPIKLLCQGSPR